MRGRLTERQNQLYEFLRSYIRDNGRAPYIREIGEHLAITSTNGVYKLLVALEKKGYIQRNRNEVRGIEIIGEEEADAFDFSDDAPRLHLARRTSVEEARRPFPRSPKSFKVDAELLGRGLDLGQCLVVRASDDGMNRDGIWKNDLLIVEETDWPDLINGELVAVMFEGPLRVVARRFDIANGRLHFRPSDRNYTPEQVAPDDDETFVIGRIRSIIRRIGS